MARRVKETKQSWIIVIQQMCQAATEVISNKSLKKKKSGVYPSILHIPRIPSWGLKQEDLKFKGGLSCNGETLPQQTNKHKQKQSNIRKLGMEVLDVLGSGPTYQ